MYYWKVKKLRASSGVLVDRFTDYISALRLSFSASEDNNSDLPNGTKLWHMLFRQMQRQTLDVRAELIALKSIPEAHPNVEDIHEDNRKRKSIASTPNKANTQLKRRKLNIRADFENNPEVTQGSEQHKGRP